MTTLLSGKKTKDIKRKKKDDCRRLRNVEGIVAFVLGVSQNEARLST